MRCTWPALIGLVLLAAGCACPAAYWRNRGLDFADCFRAEAGTGIGLDIQLAATDWLAAGVGASGSHMAGFVGRHPVGPRHGNGRNVHFGYPLLNVLVPVALLTGEEAGHDDPLLLAFIAPFLLVDCQWRNAPRSDAGGGWFPDVKQRECSPLYRLVASGFGINFPALAVGGRGRGLRAPGPKLVDAFEVDVGATLIAPSARVGFSFGQFLDFLLGWTTLDIAGDDEARESAPPPTPQEDRTR
ncbi:MAG TPA: hypothetical protein PLE19_15795 [Planctomycetota bacterium]|nr:hypothetical protein [Planctomycetota bacterium]HRR81332.1 hypothetical protein [Planctomycetota bacterium]HRT95586.1 hypothetical protein [Planctomycetota bacterium]